MSTSHCGFTFVGLLFMVVSLVSLGYRVQAQNGELCSQSFSMAADPQMFSGVWWEVARYPSAITTNLCVEANFTLLPNNELNIAITYSNTPDYPWVNQTMTEIITLDNAYQTNAGYNISFVNGLTNTSYVVFKLLATDYSNYAFICGYSDATNNATAVGYVLTRQRVLSTSVLDGFISLASQSYADFINNNMALITQDSICYASASIASVSIGIIFLALFTTWCTT